MVRWIKCLYCKRLSLLFILLSPLYLPANLLLSLSGKMILILAMRTGNPMGVEICWRLTRNPFLGPGLELPQSVFNSHSQPQGRKPCRLKGRTLVFPGVRERQQAGLFPGPAGKEGIDSFDGTVVLGPLYPTETPRATTD
jgi:hypothetical protein